MKTSLKISIACASVFLLQGSAFAASSCTTSAHGEVAGESHMQIVAVAAKPKAAKAVKKAKKYSSSAAAKTGTCTIKGNISSKKERIFHVKGCASYNATIIDAAAGEKWFCTEAEAKAAGWRKALNCP